MSDDSDRARARILSATTPLFAQRGYGSTSVRELAEAAGVTKPTLYYYFKNKEGLYVAAVNAALSEISRVMREACAPPGAPRERLGRFVDAYSEHVSAHPDAMRLLISANYTAGEGQPVVDQMSVHIENAQGVVELVREALAEGAIRAGLDPQVVTLALLGMLNIYSKACLNKFALPGDTPRQLLEIFWSGAGVLDA
jgi:AcrR family transcriptional regulator